MKLFKITKRIPNFTDVEEYLMAENMTAVIGYLNERVGADQIIAIEEDLDAIHVSPKPNNDLNLNQIKE